jgi:hypothetical protein
MMAPQPAQQQLELQQVVVLEQQEAVLELQQRELREQEVSREQMLHLQ